MAWSILQKNGLIRHSRNLSHPVITHPNGFEPRQLGTVASSWNNFAAPQPIQGCWISGLKISWLDWNNFAAPQSIQGCWISGLKISWLDWNNFTAPQSHLP